MKTHPEFINIADGATTADLYNRAVELGVEGDRKVARRYFKALVDHILEFSVVPHMTLEKAEGIAFTNVEYWLLHHPEVDAEKVKALYLDIMGTFRAYTYEELENAYMAGFLHRGSNLKPDFEGHARYIDNFEDDETAKN